MAYSRSGIALLQESRIEILERKSSGTNTETSDVNTEKQLEVNKKPILKHSHSYPVFKDIVSFQLPKPNNESITTILLNSFQEEKKISSNPSAINVNNNENLPLLHKSLSLDSIDYEDSCFVDAVQQLSELRESPVAIRRNLSPCVRSKSVETIIEMEDLNPIHSNESNNTEQTPTVTKTEKEVKVGIIEGLIRMYKVFKKMNLHSKIIFLATICLFAFGWISILIYAMLNYGLLDNPFYKDPNREIYNTTTVLPPIVSTKELTKYTTSKVTTTENLVTSSTQTSSVIKYNTNMFTHTDKVFTTNTMEVTYPSVTCPSITCPKVKRSTRCPTLTCPSIQCPTPLSLLATQCTTKADTICPVVKPVICPKCVNCGCRERPCCDPCFTKIGEGGSLSECVVTQHQHPIYPKHDGINFDPNDYSTCEPKYRERYNPPSYYHQPKYNIAFSRPTKPNYGNKGCSFTFLHMKTGWIIVDFLKLMEGEFGGKEDKGICGHYSGALDQKRILDLFRCKVIKCEPCDPKYDNYLNN